MKEIDIHNYHINFEDDILEIEYYLEKNLNLDEFRTLFNYARYHRESYFQDKEGHHYIIEYKNGEYFIVKR